MRRPLPHSQNASEANVTGKTAADSEDVSSGQRAFASADEGLPFRKDSTTSVCCLLVSCGRKVTTNKKKKTSHTIF